MQPAPKLGRGDGWGEGSAGGWSSGRGGRRAAAARAQASHSWSDVSAGGAVEGDLVRAIGGACAPEIDCVQQALDVDRVGHTDEMAGGATHVGRSSLAATRCHAPARRFWAWRAGIGVGGWDGGIRGRGPGRLRLSRASTRTQRGSAMWRRCSSRSSAQ